MGDGTKLTVGTSGGGVLLRLYAALPVTQPAAGRARDWAERLAAGVPDAQVADEHDLHVTFGFLGDVAEEYVPAVASALDAAAFSVPGPTSCTVDGVEPFGGGRVLGATIDVDLHAVLDSARDRFIDSVRPYAPHVDQRAWRPHLSLVRVPRGTALPNVRGAAALPDERIGWIAPELRLYASLPAPGGSVHRVLHAVPLGTPALQD
ncbi:MAG: hypothetical protein KDC46_12015 [Thermoleophilia bacterium]|nr:hypothetical protein [Thermoleophilia bacterium]